MSRPYPGRPSVPQLAKVGVVLVDGAHLRCSTCEAGWALPPSPRPRGWWRCPAGCNAPDPEPFEPVDGGGKLPPLYHKPRYWKAKFKRPQVA